MINENPYNRFRRTTENHDETLLGVDSYFIKNNVSSTVVSASKTGLDYTVVLVFSDKEGGDEAFLYSDIASNFKLSDYFTWQDTKFFIYEKVKIAKEEDYEKFKVLECNVLVNDELPAYFLGSKRSANNSSLAESYFIKDSISPILIMPNTNAVSVASTITFGGQTWNVLEEDKYTIKGISYFTIERGKNTLSSEAATQIGKADDTYYSNSEISLETELGYFDCDSSNLKIVKRLANKIVIKFTSVGNYTYSIKKAGKIIEKTIEIKGVI